MDKARGGKSYRAGAARSFDHAPGVSEVAGGCQEKTVTYISITF